MQTPLVWTGPLGGIADAALHRVRPRSLVTDFIEPQLARDPDAVRELVGAALASGVVRFENGHLVPTAALSRHARAAEARRSALLRAWRADCTAPSLPDGTTPRYVEDVEAFPYIALALADTPITPGTWHVSQAQLRAWRIAGRAGRWTTSTIAPLAVLATAMLIA
ncbi:hypothetical protein [Demequina phytophila]|uniref:hypothetical protein n=1 Tax=Demequina phytophila TaxID=1638981 RepID=UPI0007857B5F|nr:hypothetical protein [Demequina phytophila]